MEQLAFIILLNLNEVYKKFLAGDSWETFHSFRQKEYDLPGSQTPWRTKKKKSDDRMEITVTSHSWGLIVCLDSRVQGRTEGDGGRKWHGNDSEDEILSASESATSGFFFFFLIAVSVF